MNTLLPILFQRHWVSPEQDMVIDFRVDEAMRSFATFKGRGSMESVRAFLAMCDEAIVEFGPDYRTRALIDLSALRKSPLRSQFVLGKWLLKNRRYTERIAVFGGARLEMTIARAGIRIARLKAAGFFSQETAARSFLGFDEP